MSVSWASIAKRNTPHSSVATTNTAIPSVTAVRGKTGGNPGNTGNSSNTGNTDDGIARYLRSFNRTYALGIETIAEEDKHNIKPSLITVQRPHQPGEPTTCSPFIPDAEQIKWYCDEHQKNCDYSKDLHVARLCAWREKNNWHLPPTKQDITEFEKSLGFYKTARGTVLYATPHGTHNDLDIFGLPELMWGLLHSRSEELVSCRTVREFGALFNSVVLFEIPDYTEALYSKRVNPRKILWLFSQRANVFPGRRRAGTPRWVRNPCDHPNRDPAYTSNMVFQHVPAGGRDDAGICSVEKLKENGDDARIRWLLTAAQMRDMRYVELEPGFNPFAISGYSDYDSDDLDF